jgi:hypothetical protein
MGIFDYPRKQGKQDFIQSHSIRKALLVYDKRAFSLPSFDIVKYLFIFTRILCKLIKYMGFLEQRPGKAGDPGTR